MPEFFLERPMLIGLTQYLVFSLLGITIDLLSYLLRRPVPVEAFAGTFPISIVLLIIYVVLIGNYVIPYPAKALVEFAKGAYYAAVIVLVVTLFLFILNTLYYYQGNMGFGFVLIGLGSLHVPHASAGAGFGRMIATSERYEKEFLEKIRQHRDFETVATAYLALYLGEFRSLYRGTRALFALPISFVLYLLGWAILGGARHYPLVLFGMLSFPVYLLILSYAVRVWVPSEKRKQALDLIHDYTSLK